MSLTRDTSRFYQYWLDHVDQDLADAKEAIHHKDFKHLGEVIEANGLRMHATNLGAQPPLHTWFKKVTTLWPLCISVVKQAYLVTLRWMQVQMLKFLLKRKTSKLLLTNFKSV